MAAGSLTSNHVNYLVWRYLQESGHGEAAVKLQRDWNLDPQTLSFAPYIRTHALVSLVQKGLQYYDLEQSIDQYGDDIPPSQTTRFFGPEPEVVYDQTIGDVDEQVNRGSTSPTQRKASREAASSKLMPISSTQTNAKRNRKSNGIMNNGDTMDIDRDGFYNTETDQATLPPKRDPSTIGSPAPTLSTGSQVEDSGPVPLPVPTPVITKGNSVGMQSYKVTELGPGTNLLPVRLNNVVLYSAWSPTDPAALMTAGEGLCSLWSAPTAVAATPKRIDLGDQGTTSLVTSISWHPAGTSLAIGIRDFSRPWHSQISIWSKEGALLHILPAARDPLFAIRWNPSASLLLGISSNESTSHIIVWDPSTGAGIEMLEMVQPILDAAWINGTDFVVCGHGTLQIYHVAGVITLLREYETVQKWEKIRYDPHFSIIACSAESEPWLALIAAENDQLQTHLAHEETITALEFQPLTNPSAYPPGSPRLLATSSVDGSIRLWDARRPFQLVRLLRLGHELPAMTLSFSPDGFLLAAAGYSRVLIWHAEDGGVPKASWSGSSVGWANGADDEGTGQTSLDHSLSWDANGGRLAYGLGHQVAIINFRK